LSPLAVAIDKIVVFGDELCLEVTDRLVAAEMGRLQAAARCSNRVSQNSIGWSMLQTFLQNMCSAGLLGNTILLVFGDVAALDIQLL